LANKHGHQEDFFFPDWLLLKKSSPLKLLGQMEPNLAGMKKLYRRSYIDASYQVWFNLAKQFQRRRFV
jgi:hypothetical protein